MSLLDELLQVEKVASKSKVGRLLKHPGKYINAIVYRKLIYARTRKEKEATCVTFFGARMRILLPSATDIYLTGGKSHDSEIRLCRFLIRHLKSNDVFLDVGAHYGFFTLLAARLVGDRGKVYAIEAAPMTYRMLRKNTVDASNVITYHRAASCDEGELVFFEFPNLYSEYNTMHVDQFKNEQWFERNQPKEVRIQSIILDELIEEHHAVPTVIKIDVEGAEFDVIRGLERVLSNGNPMIVMEYLSEKRGNRHHREAEEWFKERNYAPFLIDAEGTLVSVDAVSLYLDDQGIDSDNVVFRRVNRLS